MAEIRVQEKRRSLAWLWILLLALLIAAGVWWWMTTQDQEADVDSTPASTTVPAGSAMPPANNPGGVGTGPAGAAPAPATTPPSIGDTVGFNPQMTGKTLALYG